MKTAHLKERGVKFSYIDSGAPKESNDYTTLVCVHGNNFHALNFKRLLPLAHNHNIRVIAFNRRDYRGSTPYNQEELDALKGDNKKNHASFLRNRGLEVADLLVWIINELKIPTISRDGLSGGLALLGWSLGNVTTLSFLGNFTSFPERIKQKLDLYLKHFFIYEATYSFVGYETPPGAYHPLFDETIPPPERPQAIFSWFDSYFAHPIYSENNKRPSSDVVVDTRYPPSLEDIFQLRLPDTPVRESTSKNRTVDELEAVTDLEPVMRSEIAFYGTVGPEVLHELFTNALVIERSEEKKGRRSLLKSNLHRLRVTIVNGSMTVWNTLWAGWGMQGDVDKWRLEGRNIRPIEFLTINGVNHFAIWDDPELLLKTLAECMSKRGPKL